MSVRPARAVLATRNAGKLTELRRIVAEADLQVELVGVDSCPELAEVAETELTFAGNAVLKARAAADQTGLLAIADDSGLCVDVLGGMPGVFSARWAGRHGDDEANIDLLLAQLNDVPDDARTARFVCAAVLAVPGGAEFVVEGSLPGRILRERRGSGGFGYDPIFVPTGSDRTTAELAPAEKDAMSHRGQALRHLLPHLARQLSAPRVAG